VEVQLYTFLTSALDGGEWLASHHSYFTPSGRELPHTHWIGDWVSPKAGLDAVAERKNLITASARN